MLYPHALVTIAKIRAHLKDMFSKSMFDNACHDDVCQWFPSRLSDEFVVLKAGFRQAKKKRKLFPIRLRRWATSGECESLGVYVKAVFETKRWRFAKAEQQQWYTSLIREMKRHAHQLDA